MKILLCNDDGYKAPGINVLRKALLEAGHEVFVCAPDEQRSGFGHCITLDDDVVVTNHGDNIFSVSGTPADSVIFAVGGSYVPKDIDLVISGINNGYNRSSILSVSGTAGAAAEAATMGYPSIAISAESSSKCPEPPFDKAASFLTRNLDWLYSLCRGRNLFININVPKEGSLDMWKPAQPDGMIFLERKVIIDSSEADASTCHLEDGRRRFSCVCPDTDLSVNADNHISVSPVAVRCSSEPETYKALENIRNRR